MANPELERMSKFEYISPLVAMFKTDPVKAVAITEKNFGEIKPSDAGKIYQRVANVSLSNTSVSPSDLGVGIKPRPASQPKPVKVSGGDVSAGDMAPHPKSTNINDLPAQGSLSLPMWDAFNRRILLLVNGAWKKVQALTGTTKDFSPHAKLYAGYTAAALMGALILFGVYKLIKWVLPKKEENTVKEFEENCVGFWSNLKEGESFVSTLSQKLREDASASTTDKILNKAKGVADEASVFVMEADTKKKTERSVIKKYAYILLGGIVSLSVVFVYWYYYKNQQFIAQTGKTAASLTAAFGDEQLPYNVPQGYTPPPADVAFTTPQRTIKQSHVN